MRLLLTLVFYAVLTPIALLLRVLRIDPIGRQLRPGAASYWRHRPPGRP